MRTSTSVALGIVVLPLASAANPDGVFVMPLTRIKNQSAYGMEIEVGTPAQKMTVFVDTGSVTTGLEDPRNPACEQGSCKDYGSYLNTTSTTSVWIDDKYFDRVGDFGSGADINDTVVFSGVAVPSLTFGVLESFAGFDQSHPQAGIFGLGALCSASQSGCRAYPSTLQQLADRGLVSHRVFSLYLGRNDPDATGQLIFGGVDKAKRDGPVHTLKMNPDINGQPNNVNITRMEYKDAGGNTKVTAIIPKDKQTDCLWDSGTPRMDLPVPIFKAVMEKLGNPTYKRLGSGYEADCHLRVGGHDSNEAIVVTLEGTVEIKVPISRLVGEHPGSYKCITFLEQSDTYAGALGDEFLRSVYTTFDYDAMTIQVSQAKYTDETDIHAL